LEGPKDLSGDLLELMWRPLGREERRVLQTVRRIRRELESSTRRIADPDGVTREAGEKAVLVSVPLHKARLLYWPCCLPPSLGDEKETMARGGVVMPTTSRPPPRLTRDFLPRSA